jgi:hypothetical protein
MDHDHNFKNLVLDYPREAVAFFAESEARDLSPEVRITPVREEQLKERLGERFRELDIPLLVEWPDGRRAALVFVVEEESDPLRFSAARLAHYCIDIAELLQTRRVVPVVVFLRGGPRERRYDLGGDQATYLRFRFLTIEFAALRFQDHKDSDNLVVRLNLPNMRYEPAERVAVYAAAVRGLATLEPDPEKRLKYVDFIDIYAALDDDERARYARDYPIEAQTMNSFSERFREQGRQEGLQQGVQQGVQQGLQQGVQQGVRQGLIQGESTALLRVMHHRFGDIPDTARRRIEAADAETLLRWLDRALVAASVDEVLH